MIYLTEEVMKQFIGKVDQVIENEITVAIEVRSRASEECNLVEKTARSIQKSVLSKLGFT